MISLGGTVEYMCYIGKGDLTSFYTSVPQEYKQLYKSVIVLGALGNFSNKSPG